MAAEKSEFELVSPLILRLRRKGLLGTTPEKLDSIFTQCFSMNHVDNDRPSDVRAFWAANSRFQVERTGDGEKA
jgi:hypothetical protein